MATVAILEKNTEKLGHFLESMGERHHICWEVFCRNEKRMSLKDMEKH